MSDFNYHPAPGFTIERAPRVNVARFGDGYEQRVMDGINRDLKRWSLTFSRATSDVSAIETALATYGAATSFTWTPYNDTERRVVCRAWSKVYSAQAVQAITAEFEEVVA